MKNYTKKGILQKIIISIAIVLMFTNIFMPTVVRAEDFGGVLFKPIQQFFVAIGDCFMWLANHTTGGGEATIGLTHMGTVEGMVNPFSDLDIPNYSVTPEKIFANEVPILDVNIMNPSDGSIAADLQKMVANWYRTFRNLAAVGLLSVLVYTAIRIIISSTISDKTKYKTMLKDWLVAFCLLFFMHYIMSFSITIVDAFTKSIRSAMPLDYSVTVDTGKLDGYDQDPQYGNYFDENGTIKTGGLTELIRFMANDQISEDLGERFAYTIMFIVVTCYTIFFLFFYIKRLIYIIFLTMISPLVALSYPLDKMGDGSAKGFNTWLKEYIFNLIIQPLHLLLYYVLVGSAIELSTKYVLYPLIVMGCLLQAEKVLRQMFGFDKAKSLPSPLSPMLSGAALMKGFGSLQKGVAGLAGKNNSKESADKIRTAGQHRKPNDPSVDLFDELPTGNDNLSIRESESNGNTGSGFGSGSRANAGSIDSPELSGNDDYMDIDNLDIPLTGDNYGDYGASADKYGVFPDEDIYDYYTGNEQMNFNGNDGEGEIDIPLSQDIQFPDEDVPMEDGFGIPGYSTAIVSKGTPEGPGNNDLIGPNGPRYYFGRGLKDKKGRTMSDRRKAALATTARRIGAGVGAVARKQGKEFAKDALKVTGQVLARGYGMAAGATLGVAAGLATDDMSNVVKYGALGMITGKELGKGIENIPGAAIRKADEIKAKGREVRDTFAEASLTPSQIRERQNKILDREYRKNKENQHKFIDAYKGKKITIDGKETDYWKYAMERSQEFRNYGVDDIDTIIKMQKALDKKGMDIGDHKGIMAAQLVKQASDERGVEIVGRRLKEKKNIKEQQIKEIQDLIRAHNDTL